MNIQEIKQMTRRDKLSYISAFFKRNPDELEKVSLCHAAGKTEFDKLVRRTSQALLDMLSDNSLLCLCIEMAKHKDKPAYQVDWERYLNLSADICEEKTVSLEQKLSAKLAENKKLHRKIIESMAVMSASKLYSQKLPEDLRDNAFNELSSGTGLSLDELRKGSAAKLMEAVWNEKDENPMNISCNYSEIMFFLGILPEGFIKNTLQHLKKLKTEEC